MNSVNANPNFDKTSGNAEMCSTVANIALAGIKLVRDMTCAIIEQSSWKFAHPMNDEALTKLGLDIASLSSNPGFEYERVIRYNYSGPELSILVDTISMVKSMSSLLLKNESTLAPMIRLYVHNELQNLVQNDLVPVLHRADKKKRPIMTSLMQIRTLAVDWLAGRRQDDYRTYKKSNPSADVPARVVGAAPTQLHLMRTMLRALYDDKSEARASRGFFSKRDLDAQEAGILENFYRTSLSFPYLLSFSDTVSKVSDLGDLWYREFYLEVSKQIQFPIAMSLPWILTEHVINNVTADTPLIEDLAYTMDVYNDAAQRALYVFDNQYLYDEIQAEVNLAFDQLVFAISDETYTYHKDLAASLLLPTSFKNTVEAAMKAKVLTKSVRRHAIPTNQRHLQLLGRSIDLNHLISQHTSNKLYQDIELCVKRYEASDLSYICEFQSNLSVLRATHGQLVDSGLALDNFDAMLDVVNESVGATSVRGRIALHTLRTLVTDLFPNYSYNIYTQRYVRSPVIFRPTNRTEKSHKTATGNMGYGSMCSKAFEAINKNTRGFVGQSHFMAVIEALGRQCLPLLIEECLNNLEERLVDVDSYLRAMKEGLPPSKLPKYMFRTGGCYGFFEGKLKPFLGYEDLKSEVFQNFREVGNTLFFLKDISDLIDLDDSFSFVGASPFVGVDPPKDAFSSAGRGSSSSVYSASNDYQSCPLHEVLNEFVAGGGEDNAAESLSDAYNLYAKDVKGVRSVFKTSLLHVSKTLEQIGIFESWATVPTASGTIEVEHPTEFYRLFSALNFLFCMNEQQQGEDEEFNLTDEEEFGHGFALAGILMIHNLNQRASFELLDFSYHVLNVQKHEICSIDKAGAIGNVDDEMQMQTDRFVVMANRQRDVHFNLFSMLAANDPTPVSISMTTFHPPSSDRDLKSIPAGALKITSSMKLIEQKAHSLSLDDGAGDHVPAPPPVPPPRKAPPAPPKPISAPAAAPAPAGRPPPPPKKPSAAPVAAPAPISSPPPPHKVSSPPAQEVSAPPVPVKKPPPPPKPSATTPSSTAPVPPSRPAPPPKPAAAPTPTPAPAPAPASAPAPAARLPPPPKAAPVPPVPATKPTPPPKPTTASTLIPAAAPEETKEQNAPPVPTKSPPPPPKLTSAASEESKHPLPSKRPPPPPKPNATPSSSTESATESKPVRAKPPPPPPKKKITNMSGKAALPVGLGRAPPPPPPKRN